MLAERNSLLGWFIGVLPIATILLFLALERWSPLRKRVYSAKKRILSNLGVGLVTVICNRLLFFPMIFWVATWGSSQKFGLLYFLISMGLPPVIATVLGVILLDATLYHWHWLLHRFPFLWRFHLVHHVDLDLDVSTAWRFHFGELFFSMIYRSAQILVFGVDPMTWMLFELIVVVAAQFHHSNFKLPIRAEALLNWLFVTPRMHGVHHSIVLGETNSNYSTIFSIWDRIFGSLRQGVHQDEIKIGVASYQDFVETQFLSSLALPFYRARSWKLPDGIVPTRKKYEQGMLE